MLVFCAIVPHSPLLIPAVGKEHNNKLKKTIAALMELEGDFYSAQPETVIVISPHGQANDKSFVINFSPKFKGGFGEFGDLAAKYEYNGDNGFTHHLKESLETSLPLQLTTVEELDYGCLTPLYFLCAHTKNVRVAPISSSGLNIAEHYGFGLKLAEVIADSAKRVAVIASAETSNKLTKKSPEGYLSGAKKFDQKFIDLIKKKNCRDLLAIDEQQLEKMGCLEYKAMFILFGILAESNCRPELLSYESPFGIGHLTMKFNL